MKVISLLTLLLIVSFVARGQVIIEGNILDYDGESMVGYRPVLEGIVAPYSLQVRPSVRGKFKIQYENAGLASMVLFYKGVVFRLMHDEDSKILITIRDPRGQKGPSSQDHFSRGHILKQTMLVSVTGDYEQVNKFYNSNLRTSYYLPNLVDGTKLSHLVNAATTQDRARALIDSLANVEIAQIHELPWTVAAEDAPQPHSPEEVRSFLVDEVRAFYANIFLNAMFLKRKDHIIANMKDSTAARAIYGEDWEHAVEQLLVDAAINLKPRTGSPDYTNLMEAMAYTRANYRQYTFPQNPSKTPDEYVLDDLFNYDTLLFRDQRTRFAWQLRSVNIYIQNQLHYSPILLHALYMLQEENPDSEHLRHYGPQVEALKSKLQHAQNSFGRAKFIGGKITSFQQLLERFKGRNVLIDVWATWCHPCIADFQHKDKLTPFVEHDQLEVLYISVDKPQWEDRWRQSVRINQLSGHHFRADESFIIDMWKVIKGYEGAIPRYVLVDREGQLFKATAKRPGAGLEDDVKELLRAIDKPGE